MEKAHSWSAAFWQGPLKWRRASIIIAVASVVVEAGPLGKDWKLFNITNSKCALQPTQFKLVARLGAELLKTLKDKVATLAIWKSSVNFGSSEQE